MNFFLLFHWSVLFGCSVSEHKEFLRQNQTENEKKKNKRATIKIIQLY